MLERPLLPELARSMRALGSGTDDSALLAEQAVLLPLLDARTRANDADESGVIDAFHGATLSKLIAEASCDAAKRNATTTAQERSRAARAEDAVEPVLAGLRALDELAPAARREGAGSPAWDLWVAELRSVFMAADSACRQVASLVGEHEPPLERRWRGHRPT